MKKPPKEFRRCSDCTYCSLDYEGDYSDLTPGEGATLECIKGKWKLVNYQFSRKELQEKMRTAIECPDYAIEKPE